MTERNKFDASEATMQDSTTQTTMEIDLVNKGSGVTYAKVPVVGGNTMGQLLDAYAQDLGIRRDAAKLVFVNKRTGVESCDENETVEGMGLMNGDVLAISDDGGVA